MRGDVVGDAEEIQNGYEYEDRVGREEVWENGDADSEAYDEDDA